MMFTIIDVGDDDDEVFTLRESFSTTLTDVFLTYGTAISII